jgi:hypothetical protein
MECKMKSLFSILIFFSAFNASAENPNVARKEAIKTICEWFYNRKPTTQPDFHKIDRRNITEDNEVAGYVEESIYVSPGNCDSDHAAIRSILEKRNLFKSAYNHLKDKDVEESYHFDFHSTDDAVIGTYISEFDFRSVQITNHQLTAGDILDVRTKRSQNNDLVVGVLVRDSVANETVEKVFYFTPDNRFYHNPNEGCLFFCK